MPERPPVPVLLLLGPPAVLFHFLAPFSPRFAFWVVCGMLRRAAGLDMRLRAWWLGMKIPLSQLDTYDLVRAFYAGYFGRRQDVIVTREYGKVESRLYNCVFQRALDWYGVGFLTQAFCRADADFWASRGVEQAKWTETATSGDVCCRSVWTFSTPKE